MTETTLEFIVNLAWVFALPMLAGLFLAILLIDRSAQKAHERRRLAEMVRHREVTHPPLRTR